MIEGNCFAPIQREKLEGANEIYHIVLGNLRSLSIVDGLS